MKQKQGDGFHGASVVSMASSLVQSVTSSLINAISGKGVIRARKRQEVGFLPLLALPLMMKVLGKEVMRATK